MKVITEAARLLIKIASIPNLNFKIRTRFKTIYDDIKNFIPAKDFACY
ncbi:MAG: hypothetical protein R2942_16650 [Ignavibacteria bacterium]